MACLNGQMGLGELLFNPIVWLLSLGLGLASSVHLLRRFGAIALALILGLPGAGLAVTVVVLAPKGGSGWDKGLQGLGFFFGLLLWALASPVALTAATVLLETGLALERHLGLLPRVHGVLRLALARLARVPRTRLAAAGAAVVALLGLAGGLRWRALRAEAALDAAIRRGDLAYVAAHVHGPSDANQRLGPLWVAAEACQPELVAYLLGQGARVGAPGADDVVDWFLHREWTYSDPDRCGAPGDRILALLVDGGAALHPMEMPRFYDRKLHAEATAALRRRYLPGGRPVGADETFLAYLGEAARNGEDDVVLAYLAAGGNPDTRTLGTVPLLLQAMAAGDGPLVRELLRRGADPTARSAEDVGPPYPDERPRSAAELLGRIDGETLDLLLARAPGLAQPAVSRATVFEALARGHQDTAERLLARGVDRDLALAQAVDEGAAGAAAWLLEHGARASPRANAGALLRTACGKSPEIALLLLAHGAPVLREDAWEELTSALAAHSEPLVTALFAHGAGLAFCSDAERRSLEAHARGRPAGEPVETLLARLRVPDPACPRR